MEQKADVGLIGLAVMGENLALNMERNGFKVAVYNRPRTGGQAVDAFMNQRGKDKNFIKTYTPQELAAALARPRKIIMMIKAGSPVDDMIANLLPFLEAGDVLIDGGNSDYNDTARRVLELNSKGILFVGSGISGGAEGALNGPSMMPGGAPEAWPLIRPLFEAISAKAPDGMPCCAWMGNGGAGHFVKMVHNGIEYGDMQLIAETYALLKNYYGLENQYLSTVFAQWNRGMLQSYLIEITSHIFTYKEADGSWLIDKIVDSAGQKGTGKWTVSAALEHNDPLSLISEAVLARFLSAMKEERAAVAAGYPAALPSQGMASGQEAFTENVCHKAELALYAAKLVSYAQGFSLLHRASESFGWQLNLAAVAKVWRAGCIIRSAFLDDIAAAYQRNPQLNHLLMAPFFIEKMQAALPAWRAVASQSILYGIAMPCYVSALAYFDGLRTQYSPANLIQAQRDYFGAHTYERIDAPRGQFFHTDWTGEGGATTSGSYSV